MSLILAHQKGAIGILTFNHPEKRNCLSKALIEELLSHLDSFRETDIQVVILRANSGSSVWSAGHDINELPQPGRDPLSYAGHLEQLIRRIMDYPLPVIAMVEGGVWGGATDLAFSCDILIGCETTTFAMTPAKVGIPYNPSGMIHFINILGVNKAKEMFLTAHPILAEEAFNLGILNHLVPKEKLENFTFEVAGRILANSPLAVQVIKQQFRLLTKGHPINAETFERIQSLRRKVYDSEDYAEGIRAFREKRKPNFKEDGQTGSSHL